MAQKKETELKQQSKSLDILYNGYVEYMTEIKGFSSYATRAEIVEWEKFKGIIFTAVENKRKQGRG